jgi:hypothetical protein
MSTNCVECIKMVSPVNIAGAKIILPCAFLCKA